MLTHIVGTEEERLAAGLILEPAAVGHCIDSGLWYDGDGVTPGGRLMSRFVGPFLVDLGFVGSSGIANVEIVSGVATVTVFDDHGREPGADVLIIGATAVPDLNGTHSLTDVPSSTSFSFPVGLPDLAVTAETGVAVMVGASPLDGTALVFNQAASTWQVRRLNLTDVGDVDLDTTPPTAGQALVFDDGTGKWIPGSVGAASLTGSYIDSALEVSGPGILGRWNGGAGPAEEIALGSGLSFVGNELTASGGPSLAPGSILGRYSFGIGAAEAVTVGRGLSLTGSGELEAVAGGRPVSVRIPTDPGTNLVLCLPFDLGGFYPFQDIGPNNVLANTGQTNIYISSDFVFAGSGCLDTTDNSGTEKLVYSSVTLPPGPGELTIRARVWIPGGLMAGPSDLHFVCVFGEEGGEPIGLAINDGKLCLAVGSDASTAAIDCVSTASVSASTWQEVALSRDASGDFRVALNGTVSAATVNYPTVYSTLDFYVACGPGPDNNLRCLVDELRYEHACNFTTSFTPSSSQFVPPFYGGPGVPGMMHSDGSSLFLCLTESVTSATWMQTALTAFP